MRVLMLAGEQSQNPAVEGIRRAGVDVEIYVPQSLRLRHLMSVRRDLRRFLRKQHFDVVHCTFAQAGALLRGIWTGPLVVTINVPDVEKGQVQASQYVGRYIWRRLGYFAAESCDEAVLLQPELQKSLPRRPYHVLGGERANELIGIYQLARATHAAMQAA